VLQTNGPGIKKDDQDIQSDKQKSVEIIAKIEADPGLADGLHAAFEVFILIIVGFALNYANHAEENGYQQHGKSKNDGYDEEQRDVGKGSEQELPPQRSLILQRKNGIPNHSVNYCTTFYRLSKDGV
jgi:hypothetical protein